MSETVRLLSDLIAFDTTSCYSNLELIEFIQDILNQHSLESHLSYDETGKKANLFATINATTAGNDGGIVLSGHTDVVPVEGQNWATNPFQAVIKDNRLYGRGSCDMKGFIAVCLTKIDEIIKANLKTPIHFAFSFDEEVGCLGVKALLSQLKERQLQPDFCIIGEPTSMDVVRSHKGMLMHRCQVHGHSAHSSLVNQGVNAVTMAAKTIAYIDSMAERIKKEGPFDEEFEPPYTTLHTGVINGGTVNNIIPNLCEFLFEIRNLPEQEALPLLNEVKKYIENDLIEGMHAVNPKTGFEWQELGNFPGLNTPLDSPIIKQANELLKSAHKQSDGVEVKEKMPGKVSYGTEGGLFQEAGVETIICGPGSIEQAHKPNEYVDLPQLEQCETFLSALIQAAD